MIAAARRAVGALLLMPTLHATAAAPAAAPGQPGIGRHAAELCVATTPNAVPHCGLAQADVGIDGKLRVRVDDVVYHLQLRSSQLDVVLMHGAVQIDAFSAPYEWQGGALKFSDSERAARYEIRFSERATGKR